MLYSIARNKKVVNNKNKKGKNENEEINRILDDFSKSITNMVQVVSEGDLNYLKRFKDFFEAVVAYYKFYNPNSK
jgi:CRISPR-associated protein Csm2